MTGQRTIAFMCMRSDDISNEWRVNGLCLYLGYAREMHPRAGLAFLKLWPREGTSISTKHCASTFIYHSLGLPTIMKQDNGDETSI